MQKHIVIQTLRSLRKKRLQSEITAIILRKMTCHRKDFFLRATTLCFAMILVGCKYGYVSPLTILSGGTKTKPSACNLQNSPACYFAETGLLDENYPITKENINKPTQSGIYTYERYPLAIAIQSHYPSRIEYLVNLGADTKLLGDPTRLYESFTLGSCNYEPSDAILRRFAIFKRAGIIPDYQQLLFTSAWRGCSTIADYALSHGADINAQDKQGDTSLHYTVHTKTAAGQKTAPMIRFLIAHGANSNIRSHRGETPFETAQKHRSFWPGIWAEVEDAFQNPTRAK